MQEILQIIKEIGSTASRTAKENILRKHKDNEGLINILTFVFNPYVVTGLSTKKINKKIAKETTLPVPNNIFEIMDFVKINNTGTDEVIGFVQNFLSQQPEELADFYKVILTKTLTIGCGAKTINKVYGNIIPEFNCMLAERYVDNMEAVVGKEFTITEKMDGIRVLIIKDNGKVTAFSRQGQPIEDLVEIVPEVEALPIDNVVIDGELIALNYDEMNSGDAYKICTKIVRSEGEKKGINLCVFDIIPFEDFLKGKSVTEYVHRRTLVEDLFTTTEHIHPVRKLYSGSDVSQIEILVNDMTNQGKEGVMVNLNSAPYECKRTKKLLKVKKFCTADVKVIDVIEGEGVNKNKLGAVMVQFKHKDKIYTCKVGSGFSQAERELFWENKELLLDKIIEIKYFEISENSKTKEKGLRFPTFKHIRPDKTEISMY